MIYSTVAVVLTDTNEFVHWRGEGNLARHRIDVNTVALSKAKKGGCNRDATESSSTKFSFPETI